MVTTAVIVCVALGGIGYGAFAGVHSLTTTEVPASPKPSTSPVPSPTETSTAPAPIDIKGVELILPLDGPVYDVALGSGVLYAAYVPPGVPREVIARLDGRTGSILKSPPVGSRVRMALAGRWLWVTHGKGTDSGNRLLERRDPGTLAFNSTIRLPESPSDLVAAPSGLWVSSGTSVYLLDPSDGAVLRSVQLDGDAGALSVDPDGKLLYVATSVPGNIDPRSLYELEAATGAVRAKVAGPEGVAVTGVSATADGVWVTVATGLMGHVELRSSTDLRLLATYEGHRGAPVTNTIGAGVAGRVLWVTDGMIGVVACADPGTGRLRDVVIPQSAGILGFGNVVPSGSDALVGTDRGVVRITPSAKCRGQ
jgi:sugar lactone lactonase YvrE